MEINYLYILGLMILLLNLFASLLITKRDDFEKPQKTAQLAIVWLIPVIAAIGIWLFLRSQDEEYKPSRGEFGGGPSDSSGVSSGD